MDETVSNNNGYPLYRRREPPPHHVKARGAAIDNRWIVPHNLYLCTKYNAHINVEICSSISAVKYLYKYVYKGHDRTRMAVDAPVSPDAPAPDINEIHDFVDARYVSAPVQQVGV